MIALTTAALASGDPGSLRGIGILPGGPGSGAIAVSADGAVVVGSSSRTFGGSEAVVWTAAVGLVGLGDVNGPPISSASLGIAGNGSIVAGVDIHEGGGSFRWGVDAGMELLPGRAAYAASFDGSVIVGAAYWSDGETAYRWTAQGGIVELGTLHGGPPGASGARGVSADGSVVVGYSDPLAPAVNQVVAFRWTGDAGMIELGYLPGGSGRSLANGVSADGRVIVGESNSANGYEAFWWTEATGMRGLGDLPGGPFNSRAYAASADGSVIVGTANYSAPTEAFVWTATDGMRRVRDVLLHDYALDVCGWQLHYARGVSADGRTIVGEGINPQGIQEGWVAYLGSETVCPADFNASGRVSVQDLFDFLAAYFADNCRADVNRSGMIGVQDIFDYLALYFAGCQ